MMGNLDEKVKQEALVFTVKKVAGGIKVMKKKKE